MKLSVIVVMCWLGFVSVFVITSVELRDRYLSLKLEPSGSGSLLKDLTAYAFTQIPRLGRVLKTGSSSIDIEAKRHSLEGFHTSMEFSTSSPAALLQNKHFAENYYFWLSDSLNDTDFLVTTRLSFYGVNASLVIPWFTFQLNGEEWNLPDAFKPDPHDFRKDPRIARDSGKHGGILLFENPQPMKEWIISYKGNVFVYQTHWDEMTTALSLASKPWTLSMLRNLREQNQERYASKASRARGRVTFVDEAPSKSSTFDALVASRDHLWGVRNWLFMYRYIWWPPITLRTPLRIEGVEYTSFIGAFVEYGNTLGNMVVGGLMSEDGHCASFSGATRMRDLATEWYDVVSARRQYIGERYLPRRFKFEIGLLNARYMLDVELDRGKPAGLWSHSFDLADGDFEIHEALTKFKFQVRKAGPRGEGVVSTSTASGLFEFGGNLLGKIPEDDDRGEGDSAA